MIRLEIEAADAQDLLSQVAALLSTTHDEDSHPYRRQRGAESRRKVGDRLRKRSDEDVLTMVRRSNEIGLAAAAAEAGVHPTWLSRVRSGHIWSHLQDRILAEANGAKA